MTAHNDGFTIDRFLRAIGRGPDECTEWGITWHDGGVLCGPGVIAPFADIFDHWTRDKDALLLGVGLEWCRDNIDDLGDLAIAELYKMQPDESPSFFASNWFLGECETPGETLARAIYAAIGGGK